MERAKTADACGCPLAQTPRTQPIASLNKAKVHALNNCVSIVPKTGDAGHNPIATTVSEFLEQTEEVLMLLDPGPAKQTIPLAFSECFDLKCELQSTPRPKPAPERPCSVLTD